MSQHYLDALASERAHNASLRKIILALLALAALGMYLAWSLPKHLVLHLAPNPQVAETIQVESGEAPVPAVNVYGFAYYIWQQINRWQSDGSKDYGTQRFNFQYYLTPRCHAQLQADMEQRNQRGELRERSRFITEIPGLGYSANRVQADGFGAWNVLLDMQVSESFRGQDIKDVYIRYPLRVVRFDVDREKNPWRLALDCFGSNRPVRLDQKDILAAQASINSVHLKAPALPGVTSSPIQATPLELSASSAKAGAAVTPTPVALPKPLPKP